MLKKVEAIIREDKVNDVMCALKEIGIVGMSMFEVRGHGRQGGVQLVGRAGTYQLICCPRYRSTSFKRTQSGSGSRDDS